MVCFVSKQMRKFTFNKGDEMTTYEFYKKIAHIVAKENWEIFFEYILFACEDCGMFLRTRFCKGDKALSDIDCGEIETTLIALDRPFDFSNSTDYYESPTIENPLIKLKMQLFLVDLSDEESFEREVRRSAAIGYNYFIKVNLVNESFEILSEAETIKMNRPHEKRDRMLSDFLN